MSQTLGQKRVKEEFNPDKNELVDQIKNKSAELIDLLESMKEVGSYVQKIPSEKNMLIALSQTAYEQGAMWAVKANFT